MATILVAVPVMVTVSVLVVSVLVQVLIVITFLGSVTVLGSKAAVVTTVVLGAGITSRGITSGHDIGYLANVDRS